MATTRSRWPAIGRRLALLALLTQAVVGVVHQFPHRHAASFQPATSADRGHHEAPPPHGRDSGSLCAIGFALLHLAAVLPTATAVTLLPDWSRESPMLPTAALYVARRAASSAQPRAPPAGA
jgi:hypothetical protein